jgi:hypothetical protein
MTQPTNHEAVQSHFEPNEPHKSIPSMHSGAPKAAAQRARQCARTAQQCALVCLFARCAWPSHLLILVQAANGPPFERSTAVQRLESALRLENLPVHCTLPLARSGPTALPSAGPQPRSLPPTRAAHGRRGTLTCSVRRRARKCLNLHRLYSTQPQRMQPHPCHLAHDLPRKT